MHPDELIRKEAEIHSPDASAFDIQPLGNGVYAVQAFEEDPDTGETVSVEAFFLMLSAKEI